MKKGINSSIYLGLLASLGGVLIGYDSGIIGSVLLLIQPTWSLNSFAQGIIAAMVIPGIIVGALATQMLRSWSYPLSIAIAALIFSLSFIVAAAMNQAITLFITQFFIGFANGILFVKIPLYLAEIAVEKSRGAFITTFQLGISLGILLGYVLSYFLAQNWQWIFICGAALGVLLLGSSFFLPASPYQFLVEKNIVAPIVKFRNLFNANKKRFIIGNGLAILQQVTGINAVIFFAPQIFHTVSNQTNITAISSAIIVMLGNCLFTLVALVVFDFFGRRPVLIFSLLMQFITLILLGTFARWIATDVSIFFMFFLLLYIFGFAMGLGPGTWLVMAEIYPLPIRNRMMSISIVINNVAAFTVAASFPFLLNHFGKENIFLLYSVFALLGLVFICFFIPETKQKKLERIECG